MTFLFSLGAILLGLAIMSLTIFLVNPDRGLAPDADSIRWINATHAVLSGLNRKSPQIYSGLLEENHPAQRTSEKESLADSWEIYDTASLLETVDWLMKKGGHRAQYQGPAHEIAAWDYSRALSLLSSGYLIGYLTREEALDRSLPIAQICQQEYQSWDDFMAAYFKGYEFWSGESSILRENIYRQLKK